MHPIIVICIILVLVGVAVVVRWGGLDVEVPPPAEEATLGQQVRRAFWYLDLMVVSGLISGLLASGAGGRLAMRLLAATAGDEAQGRLTEAEQRVGDISVDGTIGFLVFGGLFAGLLTAIVYVLVRKWLPRRWLGALALGALLLVAFATRADPLRADNPDFNIVGPDWVSVVVFLALGVFHASVLVAVFARLSHALPLFERRVVVALAYVPVLIVLLTAFFGVMVIAAAIAGAALSTDERVRRIWAHPRVLLAGRVAIALITLLLLPGFVSSITDIL